MEIIYVCIIIIFTLLCISMTFKLYNYNNKEKILNATEARNSSNKNKDKKPN